jgi:hypothetical protein
LRILARRVDSTTTRRIQRVKAMPCEKNPPAREPMPTPKVVPAGPSTRTTGNAQDIGLARKAGTAAKGEVSVEETARDLAELGCDRLDHRPPPRRMLARPQASAGNVTQPGSGTCACGLKAALRRDIALPANRFLA